jgi:hypothetical protein
MYHFILLGLIIGYSYKRGLLKKESLLKIKPIHYVLLFLLIYTYSCNIFAKVEHLENINKNNENNKQNTNKQNTNSQDTNSQNTNKQNTNKQDTNSQDINSEIDKKITQYLKSILDDEDKCYSKTENKNGLAKFLFPKDKNAVGKLVVEITKKEVVGDSRKNSILEAFYDEFIRSHSEYEGKKKEIVVSFLKSLNNNPYSRLYVINMFRKKGNEFIC